MAAPRNKDRKQSFTQFVTASVAAVLPSTITAQTVRDKIKPTSWERLIHCCTALGYALVVSTVVVLLVALLSTWEWVRRDKDGVPWVNNDALALLVGGVMATACTLAGYFHIAQGSERPGGRAGPRYARLALAVGAVMVPAGYGWFWALENKAGINAFHSLVHPPSLFVWVTLCTMMDDIGRRKWSEHDRRKRRKHGKAGAAAGGHQQHDGVVAQPQHVAAAHSAQSSTVVADTITSLVVILATFSVAALCKCVFFVRNAYLQIIICSLQLLTDENKVICEKAH